MHTQERNIWIFGGTGFIGKALVEHLSANPLNHINLLLHHNVDYRDVESFNTFTGDLENFNFELFRKFPPDVIFHLARFAGKRKFTRKLAARRACHANQRLISLISKLEKSPVVVYVSGSLMYGPQIKGNIATEHSNLSPVAYAKLYIKGEQPWINAQKNSMLDVRFARPGWIVGPSSWFMEFYWKYFIKTGKIPSYGDGEQLMSWISLQDCARLVDTLSKLPEKGQNLNIFMDSPVRQKEFSNTLAHLLNTEINEINSQELIREYGKTVAEAITTSIPISTDYKSIYQNFSPLFPDISSILKHTLSLLENK